MKTQSLLMTITLGATIALATASCGPDESGIRYETSILHAPGPTCPDCKCHVIFASSSFTVGGQAWNIKPVEWSPSTADLEIDYGEGCVADLPGLPTRKPSTDPWEFEDVDLPGACNSMGEAPPAQMVLDGEGETLEVACTTEME